MILSICVKLDPKSQSHPHSLVAIASLMRAAVCRHHRVKSGLESGSIVPHIERQFARSTAAAPAVLSLRCTNERRRGTLSSTLGGLPADQSQAKALEQLKQKSGADTLPRKGDTGRVSSSWNRREYKSDIRGTEHRLKFTFLSPMHIRIITVYFAFPISMQSPSLNFPINNQACAAEENDARTPRPEV
jgi:hypothetical protein